MPRGVKATPSSRAVQSLEKLADKLTKKLQGYGELQQEFRRVQDAIRALKGEPPAPVRGVDGGGVNHVVAGRRAG